MGARFWWTATGVAVLMGTLAVSGQEVRTPDANAILTEVRTATSALKSLDLRAAVVVETAGTDSRIIMESILSVTAELPSKFRIQNSRMGSPTRVSDGSQAWTYVPLLKQYTKKPASQTLKEALAPDERVLLFPEGATTSARWTGEEELTIEDRTYKCDVLQMEFQPADHRSTSAGNNSVKLWVDRKLHLILKQTSESSMEDPTHAGSAVSSRASATVVSLTVNQPVPPDLFSFTPPASAKFAADLPFSGMPKSTLEGKPAPRLVLRDLSNNETKLTDFRGKTVLLDFWTTWCAPCRAAMPTLEKIHQQNKDVVVLGINVGEDLQTVKKFLRENTASYRILLAGEDEVTKQFEVHGFPTVVIVDKTGIIRSHKFGYAPDAEHKLEADLRRSRESTPASEPARAEAGGTAPYAGPVVPVGNGVSTPSLISKREPEYSEEARRAQVSGSVVLSAVISPEGVPTNVTVQRGLGYGLDEKASEAVRGWRFRPATKDGNPVAVRTNIEVDFRLLTAPSSPLLAKPPKTAEEAYRRAMFHTYARRNDEAIAMLDRAIELKREWAHSWSARGRVNHGLKRYAEAVRDFDEAIRIGPAPASWFHMRGLAYSYSGQHARAVENYTKAMELNPQITASAYNDRGWAHRELGQLEQALLDLNRCLEMSPEQVKAYENRAETHALLKQHSLAIQDYTAAMQIQPSAWQYRRRAEAKRASGDLLGAEEDLKSAVDLEGAQPAAATKVR